MSSVSSTSNSIPKVYTKEETAAVSIQQNFRGFFNRKRLNATVCIQWNCRVFLERKQQKAIQTIWSLFNQAHDKKGLQECIDLFDQSQWLFTYKSSGSQYELISLFIRIIKSNLDNTKSSFTKDHLDEILSHNHFCESSTEGKVRVIVHLFLFVNWSQDTKNRLLEILPTRDEMKQESIGSDIDVLYSILERIKTINLGSPYEEFCLSQTYSSPKSAHPGSPNGYSPLFNFRTPFEARAQPESKRSLTHEPPKKTPPKKTPPKQLTFDVPSSQETQTDDMSINLPVNVSNQETQTDDMSISNPAQRPYLKIMMFALLLISTSAFLYKNRSRLSTYYKDIKKLSGRF